MPRPAPPGRRRGPVRPSEPAGPPVTVTIDRLGHSGDGIAETPDGPLYVPFTLPGETVTATRSGERGRLVEVLAPAPERTEPACPLFGRCGGCALQHLPPASYRDFKRGLVVQALADRGLFPEVDPLVTIAPGTRRRATLAAQRQSGRVALGWHGKASHDVVPVDRCPVLVPEIEQALPRLAALISPLVSAGDGARVLVTATAGGLDVRVDDVRRPTPDQASRLLEAALESGLARFSVGDEVIVGARAATVAFGAIPVEPPPGGFLQATRPSEEAMAALVLEAIDGAKSVADLFSGCGTFALRIATRVRVHAVEADAPAIAALGRALKGVSGLKPVTTEVRDLFRRPLMGKELEKFDAVVFDPPRAGAKEQAAALALSEVRRIVAVSCNPATLGRDLRLLVDAGYRIDRVTPIDQFLWSPHVEAVAVLSHE